MRSNPSTPSGVVSGRAAPVFSASEALRIASSLRVKCSIEAAFASWRSIASGRCAGSIGSQASAATVKPPIGAALVQGIGVRAPSRPDPPW